MFDAEAEAEAEAKASRPRPKFWPRGHFGLEDLTSLLIWYAHHLQAAETELLESGSGLH